MLDGWYRLTHRKEPTKVQYVFQNRCDDGFVSNLISRGWQFEPVVVLTPEELMRNLEAEERNAILAYKAGVYKEASPKTNLSAMTEEMTTLP